MKQLYKFQWVFFLSIFFSFFFSVNTLQAQTVFPAGFSQVGVATISNPVAMAFTPDGRILITESVGKIRVIKNGSLLTTPFMTLKVSSANEWGIHGITVDPNFATNKYIYIYYTVPTSPIHNRLSRFTANGDVVLSGSEKILLEFESKVSNLHNGGAMGFGLDGKLYIGIGDDTRSNNVQNLSNYFGKLLRLNPEDGSAPADNPFTGSEQARRIWAYGLRNPYKLSVHRTTGKIYVIDVGEIGWEEINDATVAGRNFGWPLAEGNSTNTAFTNPVYTYPYGEGANKGCAITGGTFFSPLSSNYPASYFDKFFYLDFCSDWIDYINLSSPPIRNSFATTIHASSCILETGTDGNLYYYSRNAGVLFKIIYSSTAAPVITSQPKSVTVAAGQNASFNVSASGSQPLSYQWKKNGVNITGATAAIYTITNVQQSHAGQYSVVVSNSVGSVTSNSATLTVTAFNNSPTASITTPTNGTIYRAGDVISFSGTGNDTEDGVIPASGFFWDVEFHHEQHMHPGPFVPDGVKSGSFTIPTSGEFSANVYYRLKLVVKDSNGLTDTTFVDLLPKKSTMSFATVPAGGQITIDGQPKVTPYSVLAVSGMNRSIGVVSPQTIAGKTYVFDHWGHGGAQAHNISVSDNNTTYTAYLRETTSTTCTASGSILYEEWLNVSGDFVSSIPLSTTPSRSGSYTIFDSGREKGDNYGRRIRGYVCAPSTGNYTFWIAGNNNCELWLSTDDNPVNKRKICSVPDWTDYQQWTKHAVQQSALISLTQGRRYYIEALHKEGTLGDHVSVGWRLPNGTLERPIPGSRLSPAGTPPPPVNCDFATITPASSTTFCPGGSVVLKASTGTGYQYQWKKDGVNISGATGSTYTATASGVYQVKITTSNCVDWSPTITVTVSSTFTAKITVAGPTTICQGSFVMLYANTCTGYTYQWKKNGVNITGATASSYKVTTSGEYQLKIVQGSSIAWSGKVVITVNSCTNREMVLNEDSLAIVVDVDSISKSDEEKIALTVYPNPTTGEFIIDACFEEATDELKVEVSNSVGQRVYFKQLNGSGCIKEQINLPSDIATGIYILKVQTGEHAETTKLLLSRE